MCRCVEDLSVGRVMCRRVEDLWAVMCRRVEDLWAESCVGHESCVGVWRIYLWAESCKTCGGSVGRVM